MYVQPKIWTIGLHICGIIDLYVLFTQQRDRHNDCFLSALRPKCDPLFYQKQKIYTKSFHCFFKRQINNYTIQFRARHQFVANSSIENSGYSIKTTVNIFIPHNGYIATSRLTLMEPRRVSHVVRRYDKTSELLNIWLTANTFTKTQIRSQ